ncbi:hypothetical protein H072_3632 [Dactylellina haptotyla CBS 200.50]|uniref:VASt domain-containing protein n=1 Tax=Dactylellina haptotyla (strain CBS 200.50) TaxID=1284197 RepID=S8AHE3_DACHA|nr:hypothetical protein H072_3632 [Dactylellina haptotyla CBS 200.50]
MSTGSTTSLTPSTTSIPSITTTVSAPDGPSSSPISRVISKAKRKKSSQNLNVQAADNGSSLSLSSNENASTNKGSSTSYIDKIRKRRAERKERKEALENGLSIDKLPKSRRNSITGSLESEVSNETEHDAISITFEPGLVASEPGSKSLASTATFPISISTSIEEPSTSSRSTQLQVTPDGRPVRRSTSPAGSTGSRDSSPTPGGSVTPTLASGIVIGNLLGINRKKRSDSTASNASGSGNEDLVSPRTLPTLQPTDAASTIAKPDTVVTPPTPIDHPGTIITRRARGSSVSKLPSKLSQSSFPEDGYKPLTPTIEVPTPQQTPTAGTVNGGNAATGFFSNMFSAAQTAASQFSNTIANTSLAPNVKGKRSEPGSINTGLANSGADSGTSQPATPGKSNSNSADEKERKPLAVETLGQGELSLGSLGITTPGAGDIRKRRSRPNSTADLEMPEPAVLHGLGLVGDKEEDIGQIPKSAGGILGDKSFDTVLYEKAVGTPSQVQLNDDDSAIIGRQRSDSAKSILGRRGSRKRRERGASATTQGSDTLTTPMIRPSATFAAANHKRNKDFHTLFKSVPLDDNLIEDYGCALQKEILLQGRMYVSNGHICFHSNIFGWVTTLVISFDEIVAIERKMTALVIPNAIMIQTLHARNVFASFISRDSTYDLILGIWRTIHPNLVDTINGTRLGDKDEAASDDIDEEDDEDGSEYGDDDEEYDSLGDDDDDILTTGIEAPAMTKSVSKKSSMGMGGGALPIGAVSAAADAGAAGGDFPGPAAHTPTVCGDESSHYDRVLCDEVINVPLGKVFSVLYGDSSLVFLTRLLTEDAKVEQLSIPNEAKFADSTEYPGKKARNLSYIKPLNASIGPRSTKCLITEVIEQDDMEKAVTVVTYTQTPDVPSGGVFKVLNRTCLMWGEGNGTRIVATCTVEWSGKSWIKGPIEKGANDGQVGYTKDLLNALKREFAAKKPVAIAGKGRKKRIGSRDNASPTAASPTTPAVSTAASAAQKWGMLAPIMDPVTTLVGEFGAGIFVTVVIILLSMSLSRAIWGDARGGLDPARLRKGERELLNEMWMREEAGLWDWLEDRAGISEALSFDERVGRRYEREGKGMESQVGRQSGGLDPGMVGRQVDEAIRVTEERLGVLKRVNEERKVKLGALASDIGGCGCGKKDKVVGGDCGSLSQQTQK